MYINTTTNEYPISESQIRAAFPNTSFANPFVAPEGYALVFTTPQPDHDRLTQSVREATPQLSSKGTWEQAWEIVALDADTIAANQAAEAKRITEEIVFNTQKRLDTFAQTRNYDGILSACTYASSSVPKFQAEGQYCVGARDATWAKLYEMLAEVQAGTRPVPTGYDDIKSELPTLEWPV